MSNYIITLTIIDLILLLPFLYFILHSRRYKRRFQHTLGFIEYELGWIIGINGPIRVGKTSLLSGLSSSCQILVMNKLKDKLDETMRIFKRYDFNKINYDLVLLILQSEEIDFESISKFIIEKYKLNDQGIHYDLIGNKEIKELIKDYCFNFYVLNIRFNFVQSKTPFYSNVTHNYSIEFDTNWMKIRESYQLKNYGIEDWMVLLIDELTDDAGAMAYLDDIKDLAGAKEYRRKFGQIHQERNRMITTKQDVMDEVKKYRNLTHSNLMLDDMVRNVGNHMWIYNFLEKLIMIPEKLLKVFVIWPKFIWAKIIRSGKSYDEIYEYYHNKVGLVRNRKNKLYYYKQFFLSIGYNEYFGYNLKRAEDIERVTADKDYFKLTIPTVYCWGTYDTHYYKTMQNELWSESKSKPEEINPFIKEKFFTNDIEKGDDITYDFD